jgi:hypothetical protein
MPPPRVDSIRLKPDGQVQLYLSALPGHYVVEASTSLVSWVELSNFITSGVTFEYLDSATNQSQRFYRARLIP